MYSWYHVATVVKPGTLLHCCPVVSLLMRYGFWFDYMQMFHDRQACEIDIRHSTGALAQDVSFKSDLGSGGWLPYVQNWTFAEGDWAVKFPRSLYLPFLELRGAGRRHCWTDISWLSVDDVFWDGAQRELSTFRRVGCWWSVDIRPYLYSWRMGDSHKAIFSINFPPDRPNNWNDEISLHTTLHACLCWIPRPWQH